MTREHLFRGFHPDENGTTIITLNGEKIKGEWIKGDLIENQGDYYIYHANSDDIWIRVCHENKIVVRAYKVLFETVGEFINLVDKNNKKIFEDDIVIGRMSSEKYTVVWEECQFKIKDKHGNIYIPRQEFLNHIEIEIIGNIYEDTL